MRLFLRMGWPAGGNKQRENRPARRVVGHFNRAASLGDIALNKIQSNTVIAAGFGGDAALKYMLADLRANTNAAIGDFNH